jgi:SAM-dependent methyltransferase
MNRILENEAIATTNSAQRFNQVMGRGAIQREYERLATEVVTMGVPLSGRVLDVGTGTGYVALAVARQLAGRAQITGLDLSPAMLALAGENAVRNGVSAWVEWKQGDGKAMPFADARLILSCPPVRCIIGTILYRVDKSCACSSHRAVPDPRLQRLLTCNRAGSVAIGLTIPADFPQTFWLDPRILYRNELRSLCNPQFFGCRLKKIC